MQPTYPKPKDYKNRDAGPLAHVGTAMAGTGAQPPGTTRHQTAPVVMRFESS